MTCACLYHGPSYLPVYWSCPLALPLGLPCLRGLPLWVWLGLFGSFPPLVSFLRCWLVFRWAVCTFGVVWVPWHPDAMESFVPVGPLLSVFMACFRGGLLLLLPWPPPRSALSIWGQFRSKFTLFPNLPHIFARQRWMWRTCAGSGCSRDGPAHAGLLHDLALKK